MEKDVPCGNRRVLWEMEVCLVDNGWVLWERGVVWSDIGVVLISATNICGYG